MNELSSDKKIKVKRTKDNLAPLLGLLNNPAITGAELPTGAQDEATPTPGDPIFADIPKIAQQAKGMLDSAFPDTAPASKKAVMPRVFTTGRMKVGKDYLLSACQFEIMAFADPLYQLSRYFFGEHPKDLTRDFLQRIGQWGRGEVSQGYPLTPERATFISLVRSLGAAGAFDNFNSEVDFESFGIDQDIWTAALLRRAEKNLVRGHASAAQIPRLGVSGCRFKNEMEHLKAAGFTHFHIMCSPQAWLIRLKKVGIDPNSPVVKDLSEKLAMDFDASVYKTISRQRVGPKLRVVWCDDVVRPPSSRLLTVEEFKREVGL